MKDKILQVIKKNPKHYSLIIKKDIEMSAWVNKNSIINSEYYPEMIYSALHQESNICKYGQIKTIPEYLKDGSDVVQPINVNVQKKISPILCLNLNHW